MNEATGGTILMGIDLHGTLLDERETVQLSCAERISSLIAGLKARGWRFATCTGNDVTFVMSVLPPVLFDSFDVHVLETGASFFFPSGRVSEAVERRAGFVSPLGEHVVAPAECLCARDGLEDLLLRRFRSVVSRVDRRLACVSLFTEAPAELARSVEAMLDGLDGMTDIFRVTYSSVAVDVVPRCCSKLSGLRLVREGMSLAAIADSVNDVELLGGVEHAFSPANASPRLLELIRSSGRRIVPLRGGSPAGEAVLRVAAGTEAEAVEEVLAFLLEAEAACGPAEDMESARRDCSVRG